MGQSHCGKKRSTEQQIQAVGSTAFGVKTAYNYDKPYKLEGERLSEEDYRKAIDLLRK